jgi:hypothetical protein
VYAFASATVERRHDVRAAAPRNWNDADLAMRHRLVYPMCTPGWVVTLAGIRPGQYHGAFVGRVPRSCRGAVSAWLRAKGLATFAVEEGLVQATTFKYPAGGPGAQPPDPAALRALGVTVL